MKKPPAVNFLVDTLSDPLEIGKAIRGLRAVRRLGRLAESVLARLEKDGQFDGRAAWLDREKYGKAFVLRYSRFPRMPKVNREDVPGYGPIEFRLVKQNVPGGWDSGKIFLDVFIKGAVPELTKYHASKARARGMSPEDAELILGIVPEVTGRLISGERKIGAVRLTTNGGTLYPEVTSSKRSITLLKNIPADSVHRVASFISAALCGKAGEIDPVAAVYCRSLRRWLIEDGLAERFLASLRTSVIDFQTVKSVITS